MLFELQKFVHIPFIVAQKRTVFAVRETHAYIYIRFTCKIYAFMEAKRLFTEFLIVTDCGHGVSVCLS